MKRDETTNWTADDDRKVEDAIRRGATRRDLLRMLMSGGVAAVAGSSILGAASRAVAATPSRGGFIVVSGSSSSTADTLDPAKATNTTDYCRVCAVFNRLTVLDGAGFPQMELAESLESDDAKTWTVKLRKGVTFHSGKSLTPADVVYSLNRHLDESVGSKVNAIAKQIESVIAVDNETARIVLERPNADLPVILALFHFMIVEDGTTDFSKPSGTGSFKVEKFEPGVNSIMVRNENYFKDGPYLDGFEFIAITDANARLNALLSGDVHLINAVLPQSMRLVEQSPGVTPLISTSGNYSNLNMRLDMSPGDKAGFVEGMKYLLDREQIQRSVFRNLAVVANDQPVSPASKYHNAELKPREFDPERAKQLFEKAGVLGQSIPMICSPSAPGSVEMATLLQQAGSKIGLEIDVQRVPQDGYWSNYWLKSAVHFGNINPRPTPDILFSLLYAKTAKWNESQYMSDKFDSMLLEARGSLDEAKRVEIYGDMQTMISNEAGTAIPAWISNVDVASSKLKGFETNPLGNMMGYNFAESVWLEQ
ncbi:ABC transporter substrate-binding protein [uncultured Ruegeria sp.]|uniref:ABC transporter substrate-binding protein n=1 Tax=uncultured Ruegeria sp. TaxID=259304 RepID=UPI002609625A|nr:ABC transporter substrate-binding protein [uncultured Ruegeria sp.]